MSLTPTRTFKAGLLQAFYEQNAADNARAGLAHLSVARIQESIRGMIDECLDSILQEELDARRIEVNVEEPESIN